jgi:hypothetical protein
MKNLLSLLFIFCATIFRLNAQVNCEVDITYKSFRTGTYYTEVGHKVIQTSDGNFVILNSVFQLTKVDACGNVIWRGNTLGYSSSYPDFHEEPDGTLMFSACVSGKNKVRLFKTSATGNLLWIAQIGDTAVTYSKMKSIKISSNKYLFAGLKDKPNGDYTGITIIADTAGNTIFQDTFTTKNGRLFNVGQKPDGNIVLLGGEDTSIIVVTIDTLGNRLSKHYMSYKLHKSINTFNAIIPNYTSTELFFVAHNAHYDSNYVARLDLQGNILKDTIFTQYIPHSRSIYPLFINPMKNNHYMLTGTSSTIIDSNLNIVWTSNNTATIDWSKQINCSILTNDSMVVSTGASNFQRVSTLESVSDLWFGVTSISSKMIMVKSIAISGGENIAIKNGTLQLMANILPKNALNQTVLWEVNETNKASITQDGLVTALANGIVSVTATTTDGSNLVAQKFVFISNQETVGVNELVVNENQITLYPNPAQNQLTVLCNVAQIQAIHLLDISGKILHTFTNNTTLNLSQCASGMYLVKIETDKGTVFKKLIISK